jgi:hypothetical protein
MKVTATAYQQKIPTSSVPLYDAKVCHGFGAPASRSQEASLTGRAVTHSGSFRPSVLMAHSRPLGARSPDLAPSASAIGDGSTGLAHNVERHWLATG